MSISLTGMECECKTQGREVRSAEVEAEEAAEMGWGRFALVRKGPLRLQTM